MKEKFNLFTVVPYAPLDELVRAVNARPDIPLADVAEMAGAIGRAEVLGRVEELSKAKGMSEDDYWHFRYFFARHAAHILCDDDRQDNSYKRQRLLSEMKLLKREDVAQVLELLKEELVDRCSWANATYFAALINGCGQKDLVAGWITKAERNLVGANLDPDLVKFEENSNQRGKKRELDFVQEIQSALKKLGKPAGPIRKVKKNKSAPKP